MSNEEERATPETTPTRLSPGRYTATTTILCEEHEARVRSLYKRLAKYGPAPSLVYGGRTDLGCRFTTRLLTPLTPLFCRDGDACANEAHLVHVVGDRYERARLLALATATYDNGSLDRVSVDAAELAAVPVEDRPRLERLSRALSEVCSLRDEDGDLPEDLATPTLEGARAEEQRSRRGASGWSTDREHRWLLLARRVLAWIDEPTVVDEPAAACVRCGRPGATAAQRRHPEDCLCVDCDGGVCFGQDTAGCVAAASANVTTQRASRR